jgi:hypothetical protein
MGPVLALQPNFNPPDATADRYWAGAQARMKAQQVAREAKQTKEAVHAASF